MVSAPADGRRAGEGRVPEARAEREEAGEQAKAAGRPAAWIIAKPRGPEMRQARRLFARLRRGAQPDVGATLETVPHLTLELLYAPLPELLVLKLAVAAVARRAEPCRVPALGVLRERGVVVSVELALTPELAALREALAEALRQIGASPHPAPTEVWRPHLTVVSTERRPEDEPTVGDWAAAGVEPEPAVAGYTFPVDGLTISLPTDSPGRFREIGPYRLSRPPAPRGDAETTGISGAAGSGGTNGTTGAAGTT